MFSPERSRNEGYQLNQMNNSDLKMYFDEEINHILDKIKKGDHLKDSKSQQRRIRDNDLS